MFRRLIVVSMFLSLFAWACSEDSTAPQIAPEAGPRAPSSLIVDETSPASVTISWVDLSTDETGFRIERSSAGGAFALVDTADANDTRFTDTKVVSDQTYLYRVRANRHETESDPTNSAQVRTVDNNAPSTPFEPVPGDRLQDLEPVESILLDWSGEDADADVLSYDLFFGDSRQALDEIAAGLVETQFTLSRSFAANRTFFWQVLVTDSKGVSRRSPVWVFSTKIDRVNVPEAFFVMGDEEQFFHPGNPVWVPDFNMDRFEVTNQQFATFLNQAIVEEDVTLRGLTVYDAAGQKPYADLYDEDSPLSDPDSALQFLREEQIFVVRRGLENFPCVEVSWYGADAYARFFGRRLPTESQWEKAARGVSTELGSITTTVGDTSFVVGIGYPFPWGDEVEITRGNFDDSGDPFENQGKVRSTPVGFYDGGIQSGYATDSGASPYGVDDMAGNLWEWCDDWFGFEYTNPHRAPSIGRDKVVRGGSYRERILTARTFNRTAAFPNLTDRVIGFRTVKSGLLAP